VARPASTTRSRLDVATVRDIAGAPDLFGSEGRSLLGALRGEALATKPFSGSENWGFTAFETDRYKIVVDEDDVVACQLFDLTEDPNEDHNLVVDPRAKAVVDELLAAVAAPSWPHRPLGPIRASLQGHPGEQLAGAVKMAAECSI
jgi:arylsulfatase A-like enzyme